MAEKQVAADPATATPTAPAFVKASLFFEGSTFMKLNAIGQFGSH
jgi:hypothetical protein